MKKRGKGKRKESQKGEVKEHGQRCEWKGTACLGKGTGSGQCGVQGL